VNQIEDRLRAAFRAEAETVRPHALRPFAGRAEFGPAHVPHTNVAGRRNGARQQAGPGRPRAGRRVLVPLTAAAAVAAIAAAAIVVHHVWAGPGPQQALPSTVAQGYQHGRFPAAAPPKFFVAIVYGPGGNTTKLEVVDSVTGRIVGHLAPPVQHRYFQAVAALGDNSTFVAEASGRRCDTWFYTFSLTPNGEPTRVAPLAVPEVPGRPVVIGDPDPAAFAASADGKTVAYTSTRCSNGRLSYFGQVGVINLATRKLTTWRFKTMLAPASLSLTADGRLLEMVGNPANARGGYANSAWTVRTDSASGWLGRRYHRAFGPPDAPTAAVLSPNGAITFAVTPVQLRHGRYEPLRAFQTATGHQIRQLLVFRGINQGPTLNADTSGRYLLAFFLTDRTTWVDLATGRLTIVPRFGGIVLDLAW
jgi:hypothetical protein